jgi:hypothetical protein
LCDDTVGAGYRREQLKEKSSKMLGSQVGKAMTSSVTNLRRAAFVRPLLVARLPHTIAD